ncbi:hypothetical protein RQM59_10845 [Flavobacteriaceae bacterium S356]|uniref:Uncharacterized protein n=1 Tax=Asprobacillus argus TaxID=3076534 RepID=A0ABU3LGM1_9FLAO|nr:hypothetical protein [Flavobacteriaceae bacterium S356]
MKKESVKLLVIVIVGLLVYLTFFIEKVEDVPIESKMDHSMDKVKIDTLSTKDTIQ